MHSRSSWIDPISDLSNLKERLNAMQHRPNGAFGRHQPQGRDTTTVIDTKLTSQRCSLFTNRLIKNNWSIQIRDGSMKCSRGDTKDVTSYSKTNNMERLIPREINEIKCTSSTCSKEIIFLVRMQIKLPNSCFPIIRRANCWPAMNYEITRIWRVNGDIKKRTAGVSLNRSYGINSNMQQRDLKIYSHYFTEKPIDY